MRAEQNDTAPQTRTEVHFREHLADVHRRRDRVFVWLMVVQWICGVLLAAIYSPYGWAGRSFAIHVHVYYAALVGGAISATAITMTVLRPGKAITRHTVAVAQMLWSALFIHLTGGRIETHFHIFGSLAFLAFYRDWKVLVTATLVVVADHLLRGLMWPESVYGSLGPEWWRFLEHAGWVVFEDVVLVAGVLENLREMRAQAAQRAELERANATVEEKVLTRTEELAASHAEMRSLVESTRTVPWRWSQRENRYTYVGPQGAALLGCAPSDWLAPGFWEARVHPDDEARVRAEWERRAVGDDVELRFRMRRNDGAYLSMRVVVSSDRGDDCLRGFMFDVTDETRVAFELEQAHKLEAVGRLAAGVAHEINTPIQFVADSVHFVAGALDDVGEVFLRYRELRQAVGANGDLAAASAAAADAEEAADLAYFLENGPAALDRALEGLGRVKMIVRSMKEFAHPDGEAMSEVDLNRAIETTLTIATNEFKYVADVVTELGPIPSVTCHVGQINQVVLNLVVNAAHAIEDVVQGSGARGTITVSTAVVGDDVEIRVRDSGGGIPESARAKVFDPFFTTKPVGRGTGQGLAIARSVVVDKHGGRISFETEPGVGTTFRVQIPIAGRAPAAEAVAA